MNPALSLDLPSFLAKPSRPRRPCLRVALAKRRSSLSRPPKVAAVDGSCTPRALDIAALGHFRANRERALAQRLQFAIYRVVAPEGARQYHEKTLASVAAHDCHSLYIASRFPGAPTSLDFAQIANSMRR